MLRYQEIQQALLDIVLKMKPGEKIPTRETLSKKLEVSRATVDKAVNELVKDGILFAVKGGGTYINALRDEIGVCKETWGLVLSNRTVPVFLEIEDGIRRYAEQRNIKVIVCDAQDDLNKEETYIRRMIDSPVSGMVMVPVASHDIYMNYKIYNHLLTRRVPLVFCSRNIPGVNVPTVMINNYYGSFLATRHLIEKGYRKIAFVAEQNISKGRVTEERCQGYISALMERDIRIRHRLILPDCADTEDIYEKVRDLIRAGEIDAVFGINDAVCCVIYQAILDQRLRVSDDIGVIGFDNQNTCELLDPHLSSITYCGGEIGRTAAEIIWRQAHKTFHPIGFPYYFCRPQLVERESCLGPLQESDRQMLVLDHDGSSSAAVGI